MSNHSWYRYYTKERCRHCGRKRRRVGSRWQYLIEGKWQSTRRPCGWQPVRFRLPGEPAYHGDFGIPL